MDLPAGTKLLVTVSQDASAEGELSVTRGELVELVRPFEFERTYRDGTFVHRYNQYVVRRPSSGDEGRIGTWISEPQLGDSDLQEILARVRSEVPNLLKTPLQGSFQLDYLLQVLQPLSAQTVYECGAMKPVIKEIINHPDDGRNMPMYILPINMVSILRHMARCPNPEIADEAMDDIVGNPKLLRKLLTWIKAVEKGVKVSKAGVKVGHVKQVGINAIALLSVIALSPKHFKKVMTSSLVKIALSLISNPKCALYSGSPEDVKFKMSIQMPYVVSFLLSLSTHEEGRVFLRRQGAIPVLKSVSREKHTSGPYEFAQRALILLDKRRQLAKSPSFPGQLRRTLPKGGHALGGEVAKRLSQLSDEGIIPSLSDGTGHVMMSYSWSTQELAMEVKEALLENEIDVWIDVEKMRGDIVARMAEAVEGASVVLLFYSRGYAESPNCLMEAEYVSLLGKPFIPIMAEPGADNIRGTLGIMRGRKLYVDFASKPFSEAVEELMRQLEAPELDVRRVDENGILHRRATPEEEKGPSESFMGRITDTQVKLEQRITALEEENADLRRKLKKIMDAVGMDDADEDA